MDLAQKIIEQKPVIVTITGGEPLLQVHFLIELFTKLKAAGFHTCIDTSGMVAITKDIRELLTLTDLVLLDIKHIDPIKSKNLVGFSNERELAFAKYLAKLGKPVWIRHVLVPHLTDSAESLIDLREFLEPLQGIEKIEILPYHAMGVHKWEALGIPYSLKDVNPPTAEEVEQAKEILNIG